MNKNRFSNSIKNATDNTILTVEEDANLNNNTDAQHNVDHLIDSTEPGKTISAENTADTHSDSELSSAKHKTGNDILSKVLVNEKRTRGTNHTIYLSADVSDALSLTAKKYKKSKSELVSEILREVLIGK